MCETGGDGQHPVTRGRDDREAEGARLESVCTSKGYRGFESHSLRNPFGTVHQAVRYQSAPNSVRTGR